MKCFYKFPTVFFLLLLSLCSSVQATVYVVNNAGPGDFTTPAAAISAAAPGDTLYFVGSATSYGSITLTKRLTLIGPGYFLDINPNTNQNKSRPIFDGLSIESSANAANPRDFNSGAAGSHIIGLQFNSGVSLYVNDVILERCYLYYVIGQLDGANTKPSNLTVTRCLITAYIQRVQNSLIQNTGFVFSSSQNAYEVANSLFNHCHLYYVPSAQAPNSVFTNCIFQDYSVLYQQDPSNVRNCVFVPADPDPSNTNPDYNAGTNNLFSQPLTTIYNNTTDVSPDGRFQLSAGSPAIGVGEGGVDCGIFGGITPYVLSGLPPLPIVYEITAPNAVNAADGLPVTIKVKAGN